MAPLAQITARLTAFLLWLLGQPAFADGPLVVLDGTTLAVDGGCTGHTTLTFCMATLVVLLLLLPLPPAAGLAGPRRLPLLLASGALLLLGVLLINSARIALLAYTIQDPGMLWWQAWRGFAFWHHGPGAQLFALLAGGLVCGGYVLLLEWDLRRHRRHRRRRGLP